MLDIVSMWAYYPHAFLKKRGGYCNLLHPSVCPSVRYAISSKPLDEIQPNLVCELLT